VGCSILLLAGLYVPLALLILSPLIFNIFWFHIALAPQGAPMGIALMVMVVFLMWNHKKAYAQILKKK
jgi:hypothetical protein